LNKKRLGKLVPRTHGQTDDAIAGRALNAEPWEPMPGMVKRQCPECCYYFAAASDREEPRCPDCASEGTRIRDNLRRQGQGPLVRGAPP
jgi:hypothetical protein